MVVNRLNDAAALHASRLHPLAILLASTTFNAGRGVRGQPAVGAMQGDLACAGHRFCGRIQERGTDRKAILLGHGCVW